MGVQTFNDTRDLETVRCVGLRGAWGRNSTLLVVFLPVHPSRERGLVRLLTSL